jgi:hypothetical protein
MDFSTLFPGATSWVEGLPHVWPFLYLQDIYAPFGALHLVGLALLGGCVLLLNLRLMGAGLTEETPAVVERNLRPWLVTGAVIVIGTGLIIGALNSSKLFYSAAFFIKMVALVSALIFTFGVSASVAKRDGVVSTNAKIAAIAAFLIWLFSLSVFSTAQGVSPGVFHMIAAGYGILFIFGGNLSRGIGVATFAILFGGNFVMYFLVGFDNPDQLWQDISKYSLIIGSLVLIGLLAYEIFVGKAETGSKLAKLIALCSILTWVTVAAGGRWIGFS